MVAAAPYLNNLAVIGMEALWSGLEGLDAYERATYDVAIAQDGQGTGAIRKAACESLLGRAARGALLSAGLDPDRPGLRVAALLACDLPVRVDWPWAVQVVDLTAQVNPLIAALDQAERLLGSGQVDAVVFAAGAAQPNVPDSTPLHNGAPGLGFDRDVHGWRFGEGAGAVVWMQHGRARAERRRVFTEIRSAAAAGGRGEESQVMLPVAPTVDDVRACCRSALESAGVTAEQVGYVETFACGVDALDAIEIAGMVQAYRLPEQDLTTAIGSAQAGAGYLGAAAGLAGLVRAALCLAHRFLPGAPGWNAPKLPALWRGAPFYVPAESRAWFQKAGEPGRLAGLNVIGRGGSFAHVILAEPADPPALASGALDRGGFALFPLFGDGLDDLLQELEDLRQSLAFSTDLNGLAAECYEAARAHPSALYGLAIVGHEQDEVAREIELAIKALPAAFENGADWQTPLGSYFTAQPVGLQGGVALVYPGAFNSYPNVGKDLFRLFPGLHQHMAAVTGDLGGVMHERLLYPRSLNAISKEEMAAREAALLADPIAMLISGTALTILYTSILQDVFGIHPTAAFGYSLGENSMMYATGVWGQGDQASARLAGSDAFRMRLAGPQQAIREHWELPAQAGADDGPLWSNYLLMAAPEKIQAALANEPRVYLTHVNTPRQVVIGGDPEACRRVVESARCSSIKAPFDYALHCEPIRSEYTELVRLHDWPVEKTPDLRMYSAADYGPLPFDQTVIAEKIARMLTMPLDFPRLVQQVYADGARVFIEAGAGSNCARWIDETLKGSPHLALSMDRRGTDDYSTLIRTLARLYCHRVPVNIAPLYRPISQEVNA